MCCFIDFHLNYACHLKMSLFSYNPPNQLDEEVLLVIFGHLDDHDLLRCETVCRQWRNVLLSGISWKTLFHRKIVSSALWRQVWREFGTDNKKLQSVHYRGLCKVMIQQVNKLDNNWRTGNFKKSSKRVHSSYSSDVIIGNHCIALYSLGSSWNNVRRLNLVHRTNLEVQSFIDIPDGASAVTNTEIVVVWDKKNMKILNTVGQLISEVHELDEDELISWNLASCCINGDEMAVLSRTGEQEKLSLWDVSDPSNAICLKTRWFNLSLELKHSTSIKMDDQFIAVSISKIRSTRFYFFWKKTLDLHWQKSVDGYLTGNFAYDHGLLSISVREANDGHREMYDVKAGTFSRKMRSTVKHDGEDFVGFNSKFMVAVHKGISRSELKIYDLKAVKNSKSTANEILVHNLGDMDCHNIMVSETEVFIIGTWEIHRFDFGSFECFRNEAKSVTLSLPWRSVWRSKGVDEEPLEPARHIEVYKEVLEYFHQLDMNCQTAIKCYAIDDLETSLTLGDGYIGYRQRNQKMIVYDEHMDRRSYEVGSNSVLISKTTHLSVIGKTILLVGSSTGKVTKETKLERYADEWHFNCNLLVCVHKIADHEHLLSVWRIENSSNVSHINDVTIEDYDGQLKVDEMFIAINTANDEDAETKTYIFISMKTFQVERSLSTRAKIFAYDKGCLFFQNKNLVRTLDVSSGTFLHDIRFEPHQLDSIICSANSNYVVILSYNYYYSKLNVYDLKCLKETDAIPSHLLLTSIDLEGKVKKVMMNETRIVCLENHIMYVVDLKPFDRLRCPEYTE